jgi:hypothetical protein
MWHAFERSQLYTACPFECCRVTSRLLLACRALQVVAKVNEFKPQELANVVWALASMEHYSPELMEVRTAQHMAQHTVLGRSV